MHKSKHKRDDELVPASEARSILGVDASTVTRLAQAGRLREVVKAPGIRGARMFRRADVEALAAERAGTDKRGRARRTAVAS